MAEAAVTGQQASQILREFVRDFVSPRRDAREHGAWFRAEIESGLQGSDDPKIEGIQHEDATAQWAVQAAALLKRMREPGA